MIKAAKEQGYPINEMALGGGSAGGALALICAYRDQDKMPVPVKMVFEAVGPATMRAQDWSIYGLDKSPEAAANLLSVMAGKTITPEMIENNHYEDQVRDISAELLASGSSAPTLAAYGLHDKICPPQSAKRLEEALSANGVPHEIIVLPHSGHALQNDDDLAAKYQNSIVEWLARYMPVS